MRAGKLSTYFPMGRKEIEVIPVEDLGVACA